MLKRLVMSCMLLVLPALSAVAQTGKKIDSLQRVLSNFEAGQRKAGISILSLADTTRADILGDIAMLYRDGNPQNAIAYANRQFEISQKIQYKRGMAAAHNILGAVYDQKSEYVKALGHYEESLRLRANIGDKSGQEDAYVNIGILYGKQGNYNESLDYLLKGLQIAHKIKDDFGIAGIYNNIGVLYVSQNKYDEALRNYLNSLKAFRRLGDGMSIAVACQNVGDAFLFLKQPDKALSYYTEGLTLSRKIGFNEGEALSRSGLGKLYFEKKQYDKSLENFLSVLRIYEMTGDSYGKAEVSIAIGKTEWKSGKPGQAIAHIENGYALAAKNGELGLQKDAAGLLAEIYNAQKDYRKAFFYQTRFKAVTDSIFNIEKDKQFNQLQMKYDLRTAQDSIRSVQEKKEARMHQEAREQRNIRNIVYIILGLTVLFLMVLIWQRNKIAREKRRRALEEERNRISRDLHDNLGAQLSAARMFMVGLIDSKIGNVPEIAGNSLSLLDASIADLRNVMDEMQGSQDAALTRKGYLAATEALINKVNKLNKIQFHLTHHRMEERPNAQIEHHLYRITQELINNTLKYSDARNVSIDLLRSDEGLVLMYEDDGVGFDPVTVRKGNGLRNIQTRVKSLGGTVVFDATPNAGARTIIEIP